MLVRVNLKLLGKTHLKAKEQSENLNCLGHDYISRKFPKTISRRYHY